MSLATSTWAQAALLVAAAFLAGGFVKGALGIGLPLLAMPILSIGLGVREAIAVTVVPVLVSNVWQAVTGGALRETVRRFGLLVLVMVVTLFLTAGLLPAVPTNLLDLAVGAVLLATVLFLWRAPELAVPPRRELQMSVPVGLAAGVLGGLTSLSGVPVLIYLLALRLPNEEFVRSISFAYFFGALALGLSLGHHGILGGDVLLTSLAAIPPMLLAMHLGRKLRARLNQRVFRLFVLATVALVATSLLLRGLAKL